MKTEDLTAIPANRLHGTACNTDPSLARRFHQSAWPQYRHVHTLFDVLNALAFDGVLPPLPIIHGIMPYGACIGLTRDQSALGEPPVITLAHNIMANPEDWVATLIHEMLHAKLMLEGKDHKHNADPWCRGITEISTRLGFTVRAEPQKVRRIGGVAMRVTPDGFLRRKELARWPHSVPEDWHQAFQKHFAHLLIPVTRNCVLQA